MRWIDPYDENKFIEEREEYILAVGGDGTLLRAIQQHKDTNKPFLPIAGGTENFLMNAIKEEDIDLKSMTHLPLNLIEVVVNNYSNIAETHLAFNEVSIGSFCGWNTFKPLGGFDAEGMLDEVRGAGICISTAQGSTGLNKNCGGTILSLKASNWSISGMQTERRIDYVVKPQLIQLNVSSRAPFKVLVDNKPVLVEEDAFVGIRKGREVTLLVHDLDKLQEKRRHAK